MIKGDATTPVCSPSHLSYVVEGVGYALVAHRLWGLTFQLVDASLRAAMGLPEWVRWARAKG